MSIKLVAIDIDGTLLNSKKEITPSVFEAIQDAKAAGVKIVITTGRPIAGVSKLLKELHLMDPGNYVITFNGGLVQETATGKELIKDLLDYEDYLDIESLANKLQIHSHVITKDGIYGIFLWFLNLVDTLDVRKTYTNGIAIDSPFTFTMA